MSKQSSTSSVMMPFKKQINHHITLLQNLTHDILLGMDLYDPILTEASAGGVYYLKNRVGRLVGVLNEADLFLQYLKVQDAISHIEKD